MISKLMYFLKIFAGLIAWFCVAIAAIGAISTEDKFFVIAGIISIIKLGVEGYSFATEKKEDNK